MTRGAQQTVYVLGEDGQPSPVRITTGDTDGSTTEVTGGGLKAGQTVITGQLAGGDSGGERSFNLNGGSGGGSGRRGGAGGGGPRGQ